jgi:WD40 repeat protein/mono/diheme cytochrome c family protein
MKSNTNTCSMNPTLVAARLFLLVGFLGSLLGSIAVADTLPVSFSKEVASIFLENCVACHGPKKAEGGYRIDNFDELVKPGDTGELPVVAAAAASGELIRRIVSADKTERMPADADALTPAQIEVVNRWVVEGAKFDGKKGNDPLSLVVPPKVFQDPPATYPVAAPITAMAFSPDGSLLLVGGYHEVLVWNTADGSLARRIKNVGQRVHAIVFLADKKTIAVGGGEPGRNGEVRLMDFETGQLKGVIGRTSDVVLDLAVQPIVVAAGEPAKADQPTINELAIASADGLIRIVDTGSMAEVRTIANHADWVTAIAWSDDGTRLVSGSRDKSAKVFDAKNGELLVSYSGHAAAVRGVAFLPDGKQVVSTGSDKKLHRWDVDGAKKVAEVSVGGEVYKIARGDSFVFVPGADSQLRRINLSDNKVALSLAGYQDWVLSAAVHTGTNQVAGGALNGEIRLWNATDGTIVRNWIAKP